MILKKEGWVLNEVLHGSVRMSLDLEARNIRQKQPGEPLTSALAFGVLPEIRIASRRSSSTLDHLKVRFTVHIQSVHISVHARCWFRAAIRTCLNTESTAMHRAAVWMFLLYGIVLGAYIKNIVMLLTKTGK